VTVPLPANGDTSWTDWATYIDTQAAAVAGKAAASHTHVATTELTATGTKNSTTFLRGDNTWAVPASAAAATETASGIVELATTAEATTGTDAVRAVTPAGLKAHTDSIGTNANTASALVRRSATGSITVSAVTSTTSAVTSAPVGANDVARKTELDAKLGIVSGSGLTDATKVTQAAYDALGAGRPAGRVYFVVG
jgi:hypothetical protein